jgi:hypothetical protein
VVERYMVLEGRDMVYRGGVRHDSRRARLWSSGGDESRLLWMKPGSFTGLVEVV